MLATCCPGLQAQHASPTICSSLVMQADRLNDRKPSRLLMLRYASDSPLIPLWRMEI